LGLDPKEEKDYNPIFNKGRGCTIYREFCSQILKKHALEKSPSLQWDIGPKRSLSISLVCESRNNVTIFFHNMISRWLIPGKNLAIKQMFSTQFKSYAVSQLDVQFESSEELEQAKKNLPFLEKEIAIGVRSVYHARKILEIKGLTIDDKTAVVQEKIAALLRRFPTLFDYDIFTEMQHFLVSMKGSFKADRKASDLSRIIFTLYHFRRQIEQRGLEKRQIKVKLKLTTLETALGVKEVLSVFVGLNFLSEHELFEERHLLSALAPLVSKLNPIAGSYYQNDQVRYLEIEKPTENFAHLKERLSNEIQKRIEHLVPPIFMPRNEEEVMRNILILSNQLRYLRDIPQMIISFDELSGSELCFTVIIVRLSHSNSAPLAELLRGYQIDRVKVVGMLRRRIPKEAAVVRIRLSSERFLREDYSVDLFRARQSIVGDIEQIFGQVRDYNGGMIAKQSENFAGLKKLLGKLAKQHTLLLQNFFYSIFPAHLSTTLDPHLLKILFSMLIESLPKEEQFLITKKANDNLFGICKFQGSSVKEKILNQLPTRDVLTVQMKILDSQYLGFILLNPQEALALHLTFEENPPYLRRE